MRRVISVLAGATLLAASLPAMPADATSPSQAADSAAAAPAVHPRWGPLADLGGREWFGNRQRHRFVWSDGGRTLTWEVAAPQGSTWSPYYIFTESEAGVTVRWAVGRSRGPLSVDTDGSAVARVGDLGATTRFVRDGDAFRIVFRPIPITWRLELQPDGWTGESLQQAAAPEAAPRPPSAPIIVAAAPEPAAPPRSGRGSRNAPASQTPPRPPAAPVVRAEAERPAGPGPIVIASAPPPPAAMREAPRGPASALARPAAATSREAQMQAQVETRRVQAAREAEAERQRQAAIAEQARQAEAARRAREAADAAAWSEGFGFVAALVGGVAAGMQTGGDAASITAGMAVGANMVAPNSEVAAATNQNLQTEYQRFEEQREFERQVIANMNDPNNPLTQQQRRDEAARQERATTERTDMERRHREEREAQEREALELERGRERDAAEQQARDDQARSDQARAEQERREAEAARQRERDAERRRQEEEERRQAAERERQAREEAQRREQEQRRLEAERREAERNRVVDFKEATVLCILSGPQAQFGNWDCEGPLQQNYVNFDRPNVASAMRLMDCSSYRELPRAGPYRAFGCGYGLHPTNPGASRNVPEMLGVFVDGRITFRCPISSTGTCNTR